MVTTAFPEEVNYVNVDLEMSDRVLHDLQSETFSVANRLGVLPPDAVSQIHTRIRTPGQLGPVQTLVFGKDHAHMSVRTSSYTEDTNPSLVVHLESRRGRTKITPIGPQPTTVGRSQYFDVRKPNARPSDRELIPFDELTLAMDALTNSTNLTELCHPRHNLPYNCIVQEIGARTAALAAARMTHRVYMSGDYSYHAPITRQINEALNEKNILAPAMFLEYGARLLIQDIQEGQRSGTDRVQLTLTAPNQLGDDVIWKQFDYFFPVRASRKRPFATLTLMSTTVEEPKLKRFAREAWKHDDLRIPAYTGMRKLQETH